MAGGSAVSHYGPQYRPKKAPRPDKWSERKQRMRTRQEAEAQAALKKNRQRDEALEALGQRVEVDVGIKLLLVELRLPCVRWDRATVTGGRVVWFARVSDAILCRVIDQMYPMMGAHKLGARLRRHMPVIQATIALGEGHGIDDATITMIRAAVRR